MGCQCIHFSETLGLDLRLTNGELRFYNPRTNEKLLSHRENNEARLAEVQAMEEAKARLEAEKKQVAATQAMQEAVPRLLAFGLSVEQIAAALSWSVEEVRELGK